MSQEEVAERILKDRSTVSRIDTGEIIPDIVTAAAYASVTGGEDLIQAYYFSGWRRSAILPNIGGSGAAWIRS
jgi:transcriptional regulator with XRE-family HTH domain